MTAIHAARLLRALGGLLMALALTATPAWAGTAEDVAKINGHLKRAEANLNSVNASIGHRTSPPKGSAAKLAASRLKQAYGDLQPSAKLVAKLPAGEPGVAEAHARHNAAAQLYVKLAGIMNGGSGGTNSEADTGPRDGEVKLGYPHADNFKNVLFTLRHKVEAPAGQLTQLHAQLLPQHQKDPLAIDHRVAAQAVATIAEARRQAGFVQKGLAAIPANGQGVAAAHERLKAAHEVFDGSDAFFKPLHATLSDLVNPANYPEFHNDVKRLRELGQMFSNTDYLFREARDQAAEALAQSDAAVAECQRIAQSYARLMQQKTDQGKTIEAVGNGFLGTHKKFLAAADEQKTLLPASIREDLAQADKYASEAVENQKPMWFQGGIPQVMGWADDKLALYTVLDPGNAKVLKQEVDATKASLATRADSLKELIIRENPLPGDHYAGSDRDAAIAVALSGWKVQQPDAEVLAIRIPAEAWARSTKWQYSNGTWYFVDTSRLQVRLIVADTDNPAQAIDRPVNVIKDHQKGDTMIGSPMRSFDEALQPSEYLLRDKIR